MIFGNWWSAHGLGQRNMPLCQANRFGGPPQAVHCAWHLRVHTGGNHISGALWKHTYLVEWHSHCPQSLRLSLGVCGYQNGCKGSCCARATQLAKLGHRCYSFRSYPALAWSHSDCCLQAACKPFDLSRHLDAPPAARLGDPAAFALAAAAA